MSDFKNSHAISFDPSTGMFVWLQRFVLLVGDYIPEMMDELLNSAEGIVSYKQLMHRINIEVPDPSPKSERQLLHFREMVNKKMKENGCPIKVVAVRNRAYRLVVGSLDGLA